MHTFTAIQLRDKFITGEFLARDIASHFLNRIEKYDPQIGAFVAVWEDRVYQQADRLDKKRASGKKLGKLAGIPVAIKDNIHVKGEFTQCASKILTGFRAPFDSTVAILLEDEDALLIGKTNMDEFAMGSSTENSAIQVTRNPWNLNCTPGGSSGGSAAAVAARLVPLALGSDTGGSIRQPASLCGVTGFKPTYGRVSRFGLAAFASSLDQIGPLATCTEDAALLMEVIGQHCDRDSTSLQLPKENYIKAFDGNVKGLKIGVPFQFLKNLDAEIKQHFDKSLSELTALGAEIIDIDLSHLKYSLGIYYILATAEASTNLARYDGIRYGYRSPNAKTLDEIYDLSKEEGFGPEVKRRILLGTFVLSSGFQDAYYRKAQKMRTLVIDQYKKAFAQCDLIATPVTPHAAFELGTVKDPLQMYLADIYTIGINLAGLPAISIPQGYTTEGKPVGFQLAGPQKHDVAVFYAANALEQATKAELRMPDFVKNS
ncbi:MAG: Asp-tRNA(Asn)/Glu-tRNA(Gln) amidotransferase subunit GatA [Parachlamydiaceae bacterium]|nr:Asp-tRNA(Asn)/Glu-tRNA(Gln) amidotransferase subunit GatA [Parachlamydiaceae bacterium]